MKKFVRVTGMILSTAAGVLMVLGLVRVTQVGSCGDIGEQVCPSGVGGDVLMLVGGSFMLVTGAIMTLGGGVFATCAAAAVTLFIVGTGLVPIAIASALIVIPGLVLLGIVGARQTGATRAVERARFKQRAIMVPGVVTAVRDTGVTVNNDPRVAITVSYQRTDGTVAEHEHKTMVSRLDIPGPGGPATVWYDPAGSKVIVEMGRPAVPFQNAEPEDSIPGSASLSLSQASSQSQSQSQSPSPSPSPSIVADLERLAALHRDGSLSEYEYTLAKQRLLS